MPEVSRQDMLTVLARDGMGWPYCKHDRPMHCGCQYPHFIDAAWTSPTPMRSPLAVFRAPGYAAEEWDPTRPNREGAADAWELLEAMRWKPVDLFVAFSVNLNDLCDGDYWIEKLAPELIARAAFEALEGSHD